MDMDKDYYQALGVSPTAEFAVIKAAYKALAMLYHPDRNSENEEMASRRMAEINSAYEILSDDVKRKEYDELRSDIQSETSFFDERNKEHEKNYSDPLEDDWSIAEFHYPDLKDIIQDLKKLIGQCHMHTKHTFWNLKILIED